ncbi:MAG: LruC domain-containing protein [Bacteroidota bacterium]|nr:LruC domain-containing protein [Bacteroidota bacterium]
MKNFLHILLFGTLILAFFSCVKDSEPIDVNQDIDNIIASENFDWKTIDDISFIINKSTSGVIKITSEDGSVLYHKGYYNGMENTTYDIAVNIPKRVTRVRINGQIVDINDESINVELSNTKLSYKSATNSAFPTEDLLAYWQFNETSGQIAVDSQGDNNGVITGADRTSGINGNALNFDGNTGNVEIQTNNNLNIITDKVSFSVWFKMDEVGNDGAFLFNRVKYILRMDNHGKITFALYNPGWVSVTIPWGNRIIDTDWHNVVATYDGDIMKLYIDNTLLASKTTSGNLKSSNNNIFIGSQDNINHFQGAVDQVAIYTNTLTTEEITTLYTETQNPGNGSENIISTWNFNENSGSIANDSESDNNGTISGAQWEAGVEGSCLKFDGINDYVAVSNAQNLNPSQEITIMAWAKTSENKTAKIAQKGDWDGHGIWQDKWNGWKCGIRLATNKSHSIKWGNGVPVFDEWYHIALSYNGSVLKLFVNGQLTNTKAVSGTLKVNNRAFSIGSDNGAQKFFKGSIDDVRYFGKALSQTEIQAVYNDQGNSGSTDSDGDGIQDSDDDYPNDPARAFNNFMPAAGYGSLAFEDLWPGKGDYDFNDLLLDYQFTTVTNALNKVTDVEGSFVVRAIGAGLRNGFGFQFPGNSIQTSDITVSGSILKDNYITLNDNGTEAGQEKPTIIVFDNANKILLTNSGFGANVDPNVPYVEPDTIAISIAFTTNTYVISDIDIVNFNPFLIVDEERGKEIHLADYPPTSLMDKSYFGTMDDDSNPNTGKYYKTDENLPWAINIPESFDYTIEKAKITSGHLKFYEWAISSGSDYADWYQNKTGYRNSDNIYQKP